MMYGLNPVTPGLYWPSKQYVRAICLAVLSLLSIKTGKVSVWNVIVLLL